MPRRTITRKYHIGTALNCLKINPATFYLVERDNKDKINNMIFDCIYNNGYKSLITIRKDVLNIIRSDNLYKKHLVKLNKKHRIKILAEAYKGQKPTVAILLELKNYEQLTYKELSSIFGL
jgi:hypothetical protein